MAQAQQQGNMVQRLFQNIRGDGNQQQQNPQNQNQNQNQNQGNNRQQQQQQNNQNQNDSNNPENRQNVFDAYDGLWKDAPIKPEDKLPDFKVEDKLLNDTAGKLDFIGGLDEETMEGINTAFGENAKYIFAAINHAARKNYATSLSHGALLTDKYLKHKSGFDQKGLSKAIREHTTLSRVGSHKAAQNNPFVKETLQMIAQRLATKHPDATEEWIEQKTLEFFDNMNGALNPTEQETEADKQKKPGGQDFDWDNWLKEGPSARNAGG